jgi:hypothetical protein
MAARYLEQAQGVRALCSLRPEYLRRLLVGLDGRLGVAQAMVAIAEQVEEVCLVMQLPADCAGLQPPANLPALSWRPFWLGGCPLHPPDVCHLICPPC